MANQERARYRNHANQEREGREALPNQEGEGVEAMANQEGERWEERSHQVCTVKAPWGGYMDGWLRGGERGVSSS